MTHPLRVLETDTSAYERPAQEWLCGSTTAGSPCRLGPDAKGHCRATAECQPARQGDKWACSRPANAGGPCAEGPQPDGACSHAVAPCHPVRSLRSLRGLVTGCVAVLSVGVVLAAFIGSPSRPNILSPGDLTFKHGTVAQSCDACHTADIDKPATWAGMALSDHGGITESRLCVNCHRLGDNALAAHSLSPSTLEDVHHKIAGRGHASDTPLLMAIAQRWPGPPQAADGGLACARCHHEHQGKDAKLARIDDQRCQACHTAPFASFGNGHPEFTDYPYHRRTRLHYNHVSHLSRHYKEFQRIMPEGKAPTSCLDCHEHGPGGRMMLVRGFEQACAACHLKQVEDPSLGGVAVLNLPGLDVRTLRERAAQPEPGGMLAIGEWPESASADLSPFMRLLLSTDPQFVKAEGMLQGKVKLRDLRGASAEQLRAVQEYVWSIKDLLYDLNHDEAATLRRRLEKALGQGIDGREHSALTGDLPLELVRDAQQKWLPDLDAEVVAHRAGKPPKNEPPPKPAPAATEPGEARLRWYRNDGDFSLSYRPKGHAGDFMHTWLTRSGQATSSDSAAALRAIFVTLSDPMGPGRCTKCHGVEKDGEGFKVHWLSQRDMPNERPFTKFAHVPHFSLLGERGCQTCHVLNEQADVDRSFVNKNHSLNTDAKIFESSFTAMNKAACATCHAQKAAGDSCLTCHNYHIGRLPPGMPKAQFPGVESGQRK